MSYEESDGFIAIMRDDHTGVVRLATRVDGKTVTVGSLAHLFELGREAGFCNNAADLSIVAERDAVTISIDTMSKSTEFARMLMRDFATGLRKSGIMMRPMFCPVKVPVMKHQL